MKKAPLTRGLLPVWLSCESLHYYYFFLAAFLAGAFFAAFLVAFFIEPFSLTSKLRSRRIAYVIQV